MDGRITCPSRAPRMISKGKEPQVYVSYNWPGHHSEKQRPVYPITVNTIGF